MVKVPEVTSWVFIVLLTSTTNTTEVSEGTVSWGETIKKIVNPKATNKTIYWKKENALRFISELYKRVRKIQEEDNHDHIISQDEA